MWQGGADQAFGRGRDTPHVYGLAPGVIFVKEIVIEQRLAQWLAEESRQCEWFAYEWFTERGAHAESVFTVE